LWNPAELASNSALFSSLCVYGSTRFVRGTACQPAAHYDKLLSVLLRIFATPCCCCMQASCEKRARWMSLPFLCMLMYGKNGTVTNKTGSHWCGMFLAGKSSMQWRSRFDTDACRQAPEGIEPNPCYVSGFRLAFLLETLFSCLCPFFWESSSITFRSSTHARPLFSGFPFGGQCVLNLLSLAFYSLLSAEC
jgi:hypothetical protein